MAERSGGSERRRNDGAAPSRPRPSPVNLLILTVIGGLLATTAASVIMGGGIDDGTPHGRLLGVLQRVAVAQESHYEAAGSFTPWTASLELTFPEGVSVTVVRGDAERWEAMAVDRALGLMCVQGGRHLASGPVREPPSCFTNGR